MDLGNVKDIWQHADRLKQNHGERDRLLQAVLDHLQPRQTLYHEATAQNTSASVDYEAAFGILQAQVRMATPRVALPFDLFLPEGVDVTEASRTLIENTERMLEGFFQEALARRVLAQHHPGMWDIASNLVLRGAGVCWPYFIQEGGELRPHYEAYDPGQVYLESAETGPQVVFIRDSMTLAALRAKLEQNHVENLPVGETNAIFETLLMWCLQGSEVWWGFTATASKGSDRGPVDWLVAPKHEPIYGKRIPILYVGVDGPATRYQGNGSPVAFGNQHAGRPFIADMLVHADTINLLRKTQMAGAIMAATPAIMFESSSVDTVSVQPGKVTKLAPNEKVQVLQASTNFIVALEAEIQAETEIIYQLGLNPLLVGLPSARSELLRAGTQQASETMLEPQRQGYKALIEGMADSWRQQAQWLLTEGGVKELKLVMPVRDDLRGRSQWRAYTEKDLYWDGRFEAHLAPLPEAETVVRNAQVYNMLSNPQTAPNSGVSDAFLMSDVLRIRYPQKMRDDKRRERLQGLLEPIAMLVMLDNWSDQLMGLVVGARPPLGSGAEWVKLQRKDQELIGEVLGTVKLTGVAMDNGRLKLRNLEDIELGVRAAAEQFRAQLQTQEQAKGQAPLARPGVSPEVEPPQGSVVGRGFRGNGADQDQAAALLTSQSGSDQTGGA